MSISKSIWHFILQKSNQSCTLYEGLPSTNYPKNFVQEISRVHGSRVLTVKRPVVKDQSQDQDAISFDQAKNTCSDQMDGKPTIQKVVFVSPNYYYSIGGSQLTSVFD